jgi:uncharacterized protein YggT (Ycf19 family)
MRMVILARFIQVAFGLYALGLIVYCVLGWVRAPRTRPVWEKLGRVYRPVLAPVRSLVGPMPIGTVRLDVSPAIVLVALMIVRSVIMCVLFGTVGW